MGRPRAVWHPSRVAALIRMRDAGMPWRRIGEELRLPHITCARYWREVLHRPGGNATAPYRSPTHHTKANPNGY